MRDLEQLVRYLDGELTESEKQQLLEKLKNDPSLREKLELISDVDKLLGDKHLENFEESVSEIEAVHSGKTKPDSDRKLKWLAAAAIFLILISAASYFIFYKTTSGEKLFAAYYERLPADFATRSPEAGNDDLDLSLRLYNTGKFQEATGELRKIVQKQPDDYAAGLYLGICYMETDQENNAASEFRKVLNSGDPVFEEHALWYLSLSYIKAGQTSLAIPMLKKLAGSQTFYKEKASGLLNKVMADSR